MILGYILFGLVFILAFPDPSSEQVKHPDALLELTRQKAQETDSLLKQIEEDNELAAKYMFLLFSNPPERSLYDPGRYMVDEKGVYGDSSDKRETSVWFKGKPGPLPEEVVKQVQITESIEEQYKKLKKRHASIKWVYMITAEGVLRVYPRDAKGKYSGEADPREMPAYVLNGQEKNPQRQTIWTEPYKEDPEGKWMVTCATPVYQKSKFLGVQAVDIILDKLKDKVLKVKGGKNSIVLLLDKKGNILLHTDPPKGGQKSKEAKKQEDTFNYTNLTNLPGNPLQEIMQEMSEGREGVVRFNLNDQVKYFAFVPIKTTGWIYGIMSKI